MVITLKDTSRGLEKLVTLKPTLSVRAEVAWYDANNMIAKVVKPESHKEDIDLPVEEHLIVELYSK